MTTRIVPDSYATIQLALDACTNGDTVQVKADTYAESYLRLPWLGTAYAANVTVEPYPGDEGSVILDDAGTATNHTFVIQGDGFVLSPGFIITNRNVLYGAVHLVADGCEVSAVLGSNHAGGGVKNAGVGNVIDVWYQPAGTKGVSQASGASALTINNAVFVVSTQGVEDYSNTDVFRHVLVVGTSNHAYYLTHTSTCRNCIAYGGTGGNGFYLGHAGVDVDCCGAYGGSFASLFNEAVGTAGANCVTTDPGFEDAGGGDYSLSNSSGYRNIGETIPAVTTDIDGNPRPSGAGYDIGPYEYQYPTDPIGPPTGTLIYDPSGSATSLTTTALPERVATEHAVSRPRQTIRGGRYVQTFALTDDEMPTGELSLVLTASERVTFQGWIDSGLKSGTTLRVFPLSTDTGTYTDVILRGARLEVRYEFIQSGWFRVSLPVFVTNEVTP